MSLFKNRTITLPITVVITSCQLSVARLTVPSLRSVLYLVRGECLQDVVNSRTGATSHFIVGSVLYGVRHVNSILGNLWHAKGLGLMMCRFNKFARRDHDRRNISCFVINQVVHTARRAGPSISESLDHRFALFGNLSAQVFRCWFGKGRFVEA